MNDNVILLRPRATATPDGFSSPLRRSRQNLSSQTSARHPPISISMGTVTVTSSAPFLLQHRHLVSRVTAKAFPSSSTRVKAGTFRRVFIGVGVSSLVQIRFGWMSSGSSGGGGDGGWRPFTALAGSLRGSPSVEQILKNVDWPEEFPFKEEDFSRFDESSDSSFYAEPRFVTHIDDPAIAALTKYYAQVFPPSNTPGVSILDLCSSWVSHYPAGYKQERIVGMGMNEEELKRNSVLTEYYVQDLNVDPKLPFGDNSFDVITNVVSVDYLTKPIVVFREMQRILKPEGLAIMSFSNRCFWTKAISVWTSTGDADHALIVGSYFHYAGGYEPPEALDISPNPGRSDPMYIVYSRKTLNGA